MVGATISMPVPRALEAVRLAQLFVPKVREDPVVVELAAADRLMVPDPIEATVAPAGMAGPTTDIPTESPAVDPIAVTVTDPSVVFPVVTSGISSETRPR